MHLSKLRNYFNKSLKHALAFLIFFLLISCNDTPDPIGVSFFPSSDLETTNIDTIYATQHTSTHYLLNTYYAERLMLGINTNNSWRYTAWSCLKFVALPDSLFDMTIDSVYIKMKKSYAFGDTTTNLNFSVYAALKEWTGDSLSYDSLKNLGVYYSNPPLIANYAEDSDGWLTINIQDTAVIRAWFDSSSDNNKGVFLGPSETGNTKLIKGYYSFNLADTSNMPRLVVKYRKNGESNIYIHTKGISKYISHISTGSFQFDADTMINIQNGIAYHGNLWFDNLNIPKQSSIYRATLELSLSNSMSNIQSNRNIYAARTKADGSIDLNYYAYSGSPVDQNANPQIYTFEITYIVNAWLRGATIPKLILYGQEQSLSFDLFRFYGSGINTPKTLKPRIIITYFSK